MTDRSLSCFFVRELFPLFSEKKIDNLREKQIKHHLASCKECAAYYERLEKAKTQLERLAGTKVSQSLISYLKQEHHFWIEATKKVGWSQWPPALKWAVQLSSVTIILIASIHYFPWLKLARTVQKMRPKPDVIVMQTPPPAEATPPPLPAKVAGPVFAAGASATPVEIVANVTPPLISGTSDEEGAETAGVEDTTQKASGFVWRGTLKVEELSDDVGIRVTKTIMDLGGTKAGQVELGWRRGNQRYYHFILPEENYEKLLSILNTEGIVQLNKERHPRQIKEGHMRIIMTIEESEGEN